MSVFMIFNFYATSSLEGCVDGKKYPKVSVFIILLMYLYETSLIACY